MSWQLLSEPLYLSGLYDYIYFFPVIVNDECMGISIVNGSEGVTMNWIGVVDDYVGVNCLHWNDLHYL